MPILEARSESIAHRRNVTWFHFTGGVAVSHLSALHLDRSRVRQGREMA